MTRKTSGRKQTQATVKPGEKPDQVGQPDEAPQTEEQTQESGQTEASSQTDQDQGTQSDDSGQEDQQPEKDTGGDGENKPDESPSGDLKKTSPKTKGGMVDAVLKTRHCRGGNCKEAGETMRMSRGEYERLKKYDRVE